GHSAAKNLPTTWSETENILWKTPIAGRAWSSPVFADGVIWLTNAVETHAEDTAAAGDGKEKEKKKSHVPLSVNLRVVSLDAATGKLLSDTDLWTFPKPPEIHSLNSYASPTPVLDGNLLLCHFGELGTAAFDIQTKKVLWKVVLPAALAVGAGSTPVQYGD